MRADRALTIDQIDFARSAAKLSHPMFALQATVAALVRWTTTSSARLTPSSSVASVWSRKIGHLVGAIAQAADGRDYEPPREDDTHAEMLVRMVTGQEPTELTTRIMNALLILQADHSAGNASTFTSRVVASTKSEPEAVVSAGIGALSGPAPRRGKRGVTAVVPGDRRPGLGRGADRADCWTISTRSPASGTACTT